MLILRQDWVRVLIDEETPTGGKLERYGFLNFEEMFEKIRSVQPWTESNIGFSAKNPENGIFRYDLLGLLSGTVDQAEGGFINQLKIEGVG